ncbi:cytochrome b/b6 domain-containing protein [Modicisalibacter radicis]|uniref:cytochrome b/b6 domain-containing protein n=1 Tax=Halomonas sp. EAR18 TaxID=2518972 RepID=UPI00109C826A|nr:cytochrome b/b6 domain-containing protein [Halomonas sp. EAR18]
MQTDHTAPVRIWDPLVRLFHWSLVIAFTIAWLTGDDGQQRHEWAGYVVAALVAMRLVWGLMGPRYARFGQFVRSPRMIARYLSQMMKRDEPRYLGHNPAGGAMIVILLGALSGTALTGWMYTTDAFWGIEWVEETHELLANSLLFLIGLHVAGVLVSSWMHRENLIRAMWTGKKRGPAVDDIA